MGSNSKDGRPPLGPGNPSQVSVAGELARQSSIYSLTFDEFQNCLGGLGKDFGSMNMDEFLKNICTAEETQGTASSITGGFLPEGSGSGLRRQGSLTLPRTLSQKTVDEVWKDLFRESSDDVMMQGYGVEGLQPQMPQQTQWRQPTLGEMTLEEFLVRAGVVREDNLQNERPLFNNNNNNSSSGAGNTIFFGDYSGASSTNSMGLALGFNQPSQGNVSVAVSQPILSNDAANMRINGVKNSFTSPIQLGNNIELGNQSLVRGGGIAGIGDPTVNKGLVQTAVGLGANAVTVTATGSPVKPISSEGFELTNGDLSSLSPVPYTFSRGLGRRSNGVEKIIERRQRRMIKNRESAARSRARKQAYTMELEAEVAKLKEQNEELKKRQLQEEIVKLQKIQQVLESINQQNGSKRRCLRRTQTGPW